MKRNKKITIILCILIALIAHITYAFNVEKIGQRVFVETLEVNSNNGRICAKNNKHIIFFDSKDNCIKIKNSNDKNIKSLHSIENLSYITATNDFVYFVTDDVIYQIDYDGNIFHNSNEFYEVEKIIALDEKLYVHAFHDIDGQRYFGIHTLPINNINETPVFEKHIDDEFRYVDWQIPYRAEEISTDNPRISENGFSIQLPKEYYYRYLCYNEKNNFILLGQQWERRGRNHIDLPTKFHISDILIEAEPESGLIKELYKTEKGERILGYVNNNVLIIRGRKIFRIDTIQNSRNEIGSLNYFDSIGNLGATILGTELFIYKYNDYNTKLVFMKDVTAQ